MKPLRLAVAALALVQAVSLAAADAGADTYRVRLVDVIDKSGFERPMVAARIAVPHDWKARGKVEWQVRNLCSALPVLIEFEAKSPDGRRGFTIYPTATWYWDNMAQINREYAAEMEAQMRAMGVPYTPMALGQTQPGKASNGCFAATISDAPTLLRQFGLGHLRRGAVRLDGRPRPELVPPNQRYMVQRAAMGIESIGKHDIAEMLVGFNHGGRDYVEIMRGVVLASQVTMPSFTGRGSPMINGQGQGTIYAFHAPDGQMDFKLFETIAASVSLDPKWQARVHKVMVQNARMAQKHIAERARMTRQHNREMMEIIRSGFRERQRIMDRSARRFNNYIRGEADYIDPPTGEIIRLPNTHRYTWRMVDGNYLLTDDPDYDPNAKLYIESRRLKRRP